MIQLRFWGDESARRMNAVFAENVSDLLDKVQTEGDGVYPPGFLHTSTNAHPGTCYHNQMWARDCGRGVIELARLGFQAEAESVCEYFLAHITHGDHWAREIHCKEQLLSDELDGNALILLAFYNVWLMSGRDKKLGAHYLGALAPVLLWAAESVEKSACRGLLRSRSELSFNPETPHCVFGLYGNYAMFGALSAFAEMCDREQIAGRVRAAADRLGGALFGLVSDGVKSKAGKDCWFNAIDERDGSAYDEADFAKAAVETWHSTRQLPFILNNDASAGPLDFVCGGATAYSEIDENSYRLVRRFMASSPFFRKYGFVSNTGWTGMEGRHDDTMCGYGQGFFTQAALCMDDVNAYGKCLEGVSRLAYDGGVIEHLSSENNPFVLHECFCYPNYETGLDHTFGAMSEGRSNVMDNPGDEGNLVQAAEVVKALRMVPGVSFEGGTLTVAPRLPWLWDAIEVSDFPVLDREGKPGRIAFRYENDRAARKSILRITQGFELFDKIVCRFGPYPAYLRRHAEASVKFDASWIVKEIDSPTFEFSL